MTITVGTHLDHYKIVSQIGRAERLRATSRE